MESADRDIKEGSFSGPITLVGTFRSLPEVVEAEVAYRISIGSTSLPIFLSIKVDGALLPLSAATDSSLLESYIKNRAKRL